MASQQNDDTAQHAPSAGKLFVGQVPAVCTEDMLRPVFTPFGQIIEIKIMRDAPGGRSKGCAWVKYATREQAQAAIDALHEKHTIPPQTNTLQVRFADEKSRSAAQQPQSADPLAQQSTTAFVGNLPTNTTSAALKEFVEGLVPGIQLKEVNVPQNKLFGFLTFENANDCQHAVSQLALANPTLNGNQLRIQSARPRTASRGDQATAAAMMMNAASFSRGGFMMPPMAPDPMFFGRPGYGGFSPYQPLPYGMPFAPYGMPPMNPYGVNAPPQGQSQRGGRGRGNSYSR